MHRLSSYKLILLSRKDTTASVRYVQCVCVCVCVHLSICKPNLRCYIFAHLCIKKKKKNGSENKWFSEGLEGILTGQ